MPTASGSIMRVFETSRAFVHTYILTYSSVGNGSDAEDPLAERQERFKMGEGGQLEGRKGEEERKQR